MIFALILLVLLGISMLYNVGTFFSHILHGNAVRYTARTGGPKLQEMVTEDNDATDKIAVIKIDGIITSARIDQGGFNMVEVVRAQLKRAEEDTRVKGVILKVDSPGGEVLASDEISTAIAKFQDKTRKPVVASMEGLAASGGYYVSAPCRWIVANDMTITGSIGVIMSLWNYRGLMDKVGLVPQTYKSGKYKDMLSGSREPESVTEEEREMVRALIMDVYGKFTNVVAKGRGKANELNKNEGKTLDREWQSYADGRVLSGTEALRLGFLDELGGFERAVERTKKIAGMTSANLVEYQQRYDLADLLRLFGKGEGKGVKLDLGLEMPKLKAGQPYFLLPTFAP